MRTIRWSPAAAEDLEQISRYLIDNLPSLEQSTIRKLYAAALSLRKTPYRGRPGRKEGTRELLMLPMPYVIVYGVDPALVNIFRVLHASRNWP